MVGWRRAFPSCEIRQGYYYLAQRAFASKRLAREASRPATMTRPGRRKGALSQETAKLMVFKLVMAAAKTWRRLKGENQLPKVIEGVTFKDGVEVTTADAQDAA
jgi:hypothetical protein